MENTEKAYQKAHRAGRKFVKVQALEDRMNELRKNFQVRKFL